MDEGLKVRKIENGTVIDHIPKGKSLIVLKILGIDGSKDNTVAILINVESSKLGKKDIVKIENRELTEDEVNLIALVAPSATINIIRNYKVIKKYNVKPPKRIINLLRCPNPSCITNSGEDIKPKFRLVKEKPIVLQCEYCWSYLMENEILEQLER